MRAELKGLHSPDVQDLETWQPERPDHFGFLLQVMAGSTDTAGYDSFSVQVCTPSWFAENLLSQNELRSGEHTLFMRCYDFQLLTNYVRRYCARCEGNTWTEVARKLGRLGTWEFEN